MGWSFASTILMVDSAEMIPDVNAAISALKDGLSNSFDLPCLSHCIMQVEMVRTVRMKTKVRGLKNFFINKDFGYCL